MFKTLSSQIAVALIVFAAIALIAGVHMPHFGHIFAAVLGGVK